MRSVITDLLPGPGLAMAMVLTASISVTAGFHAPAPGEDLVPLAGAEELVDLSQDEGWIRWSAMTGGVSAHTVRGWPSQVGDVELGGGMVIERPLDGRTGEIQFGEKPMSIEFVVRG